MPGLQDMGLQLRHEEDEQNQCDRTVDDGRGQGATPSEPPTGVHLLTVGPATEEGIRLET